MLSVSFMRADLSATELEARIPVWEALSALWLDTELQPCELENIARTIALSPYSVAQMQEIRDYELMPVLGANLLSVAGEWAGFDAPWLIRQCRRNVVRRESAWFRLRCTVRVWLLEKFIRSDWQQLMERVCGMRSNTPRV